jgi:hypothetical protein
MESELVNWCKEPVQDKFPMIAKGKTTDMVVLFLNQETGFVLVPQNSGIVDNPDQVGSYKSKLDLYNGSWIVLYDAIIHFKL